MGLPLEIRGTKQYQSHNGITVFHESEDLPLHIVTSVMSSSEIWCIVIKTRINYNYR